MTRLDQDALLAFADTLRLLAEHGEPVDLRSLASTVRLFALGELSAEYLESEALRVGRRMGRAGRSPKWPAWPPGRP